MYKDLPLLKSDLLSNATIQVSLISGVPGKDELIDHEVLSFEFKETKSGLLLLLELKNKENNESYFYAFPDIRKVEKHDFEQKYYLHSLNRAKLSDHQLNKTSRLLRQNKNVDNIDVFEDAPLITNRILIK